MGYSANWNWNSNQEPFSIFLNFWFAVLGNSGRTDELVDEIWCAVRADSDGPTSYVKVSDTRPYMVIKIRCVWNKISANSTKASNDFL